MTGNIPNLVTRFPRSTVLGSRVAISRKEHVRLRRSTLFISLGVSRPASCSIVGYELYLELSKGCCSNEKNTTFTR